MYAFGIFRWECYTGDVPFRGFNPSLIGDRVMRGVRPALPDALIDGFPPEFVALMQVCAPPPAVPLFARHALCRSACIRTRPRGRVSVKCSAVLWPWTPPPDPASRCLPTDATHQHHLPLCPASNTACKLNLPNPAPPAPVDLIVLQQLPHLDELNFIEVWMMMVVVVVVVVGVVVEVMWRSRILLTRVSH